MLACQRFFSKKGKCTGFLNSLCTQFFFYKCDYMLFCLHNLRSSGETFFSFSYSFCSERTKHIFAFFDDKKHLAREARGYLPKSGYQKLTHKTFALFDGN